MDSKFRKTIKKIFFQKKVMGALFVLVIIGVGGMLSMAKNADKPEFCASCHNIKPYYDSWHDSNLLAKKHADAHIDCHSCHEESMEKKISEGIKYITGTYDMSKRKFPNEMCTKCHNDMDKIKAKTVFDNKGEKVNPHDAHPGEQNCTECHSMHRQSTVMCSECHIQPWMNKLPDDWNTPETPTK
jgi:NapC/NirT cytochrome c family, N-terminal region.